MGVTVETRVLVSQAGDVVPQVVQRMEDEEYTTIGSTNDGFLSLCQPRYHPACGSETVLDVVGSSMSSGDKTATKGQVLWCGGQQLPPTTIHNSPSPTITHQHPPTPTSASSNKSVNPKNGIHFVKYTQSERFQLTHYCNRKKGD